MGEHLLKLFGLEGQVAVVTGASGALGSAMALGLAQAGAKVVVLGRNPERTEQVAESIRQSGGAAIALTADVLDKAQLQAVSKAVLEQWGQINILVNAAGGNVAAATISPQSNFFELPLEAFQQVFELNLTGTVLASQVFGAAMAHPDATKEGLAQGCIVNISSMAAGRAISRVVGYSAAKAAVENFTRWLAVELSSKFGAGLRVNAIAPGFFIGEQNRRLLLEEDGSLTARGRLVVQHTPAGRFGQAEELVGALIWLCSPSASFVNGVVVPVDGGFSVFSGV